MSLRERLDTLQVELDTPEKQLQALREALAVFTINRRGYCAWPYEGDVKLTVSEDGYKRAYDVFLVLERVYGQLPREDRPSKDDDSE